MSDAARFRSMNFGLHYDNMAMIGGGDVIVASLGGAGQSLLGNILLELGLDYVNLATEKLLSDRTTVPLTDPHSTTRRHRLAATFHRDQGMSPSEHRVERRFMKTHLPAAEFDGCRFDGVWLLVRDPRDALYSWHQFHRRFAEREWEQVPESFEEFLIHPFFTRLPPVQGWAHFHDDWLERGAGHPYSTMVRFEDLKLKPLRTMRALMRTVGIDVRDDDLRRAIEHSSYDSMRAHEDAVARQDETRPDARIMRKGTIDEWRGWMTPRLERHFQDEHLRRVAHRLGYTVAASSP